MKLPVAGSIWIGPPVTEHVVRGKDWYNRDIVDQEQTFAWKAVVPVRNPLPFAADAAISVDLLDAKKQRVHTVGVWTIGTPALLEPAETHEHRFDGTEVWRRPIASARVRVRYEKLSEIQFDVHDAVLDRDKIRCTLDVELEHASKALARLKVYSASGAIMREAHTINWLQLPAGKSSVPLELEIRPMTTTVGKVTCRLRVRTVAHEDPEGVLELVDKQPRAKKRTK